MMPGLKVLFLYAFPHPCHRGFAQSINADFRYYSPYLKQTKLPRGLKYLINGPLIPRYDTILTEGGTPLIVMAINKLLHPDIVHINLISDETFTMMENTPKEMIGDYSEFINFAHKLASKYIDGGIAVSSFSRDSAKQFIDVPINIAHPYIEDDLYVKLGNVKPNLLKNNIISVGYNRPMKGMDILIEAFKIVKKEIKNSKLFIIGAGIPKEFEKIEGIHVVGYVNDLIPYFENSSLYVQSSRGDAFPVATLESLRAGLPTIVTEKTGTKEVVSEYGKEFVRKVDPVDLAEGILYYFYLKDEKKLEISRQAKKLSEKFNQKDMCELFKTEFFSLHQQLTR